MKDTYRNLFFIIGCAAVIVMLLTMDFTIEDVKGALRRASYGFPALIVLWLFIYAINAYAWYIILHSGFSHAKVGFWRVYKYTVTGFALNAVTPVGLMGGEPYRIMETSPYVGVEKATSSVVLYVMMHIFSHFCFWLFSVLLYFLYYFEKINVYTGILLGVTVAVCSLGIYCFSCGYRNGLIVNLLHRLSAVPFVGKWAARFSKEKEQQLQEADAMIIDLHLHHKKTFYLSLFAEFMARVISCAEVYVVLYALGATVSYMDCILVLAFTSLFANAMFFLPLQLGAREGGFAMVINGLSFPSGYGVILGLIIRLRELVCVCLGLLLMKFGNRVHACKTA